VPELTVNTDMGRPVIHEFSAIQNELKIGTVAQLQIKVHQPEGSHMNLQYKIFAEGGRVYRDNEVYFYVAEKEGKDRIILYVTNPAGLTSMNEFILTVNQ
jgi:hypothetical protein